MSICPPFKMYTRDELNKMTRPELISLAQSMPSVPTLASSARKAEWIDAILESGRSTPAASSRSGTPLPQPSDSNPVTPMRTLRARNVQPDTHVLESPSKRTTRSSSRAATPAPVVENVVSEAQTRHDEPSRAETNAPNDAKVEEIEKEIESDKEDKKDKKEASFSIVYTVAVLLLLIAFVYSLSQIDPVFPTDHASADVAESVASSASEL